MMIFPLSLVSRKLRALLVLGAYVTILFGNLLGAIIVAVLTHGTGVMDHGTPGGWMLRFWMHRPACRARSCFSAESYVTSWSAWVSCTVWPPQNNLESGCLPRASVKIA